MKLISVLIISLIGFATSKSVYFPPQSRYILYVENNLGEIEKIDLRDYEIELTASIDDVTYYLYTLDNKDEPFEISKPDASILINNNNSTFKVNRPNIFLIHGWHNNKDSPMNQLIKNAILNNKNDYNVFVCDWSPLSKKNYLTARYAVPDIGKFIGNFINDIQKFFKLNGNSFKIIGHSLGAHVAGNAGMIVKNNISAIVGLDPAGPLFEITNNDEKLDSTDADYVEVIHTNGALLGAFYNLGDADFYPNGGRIQPGCLVDITGSCSHRRSYEYYVESINGSNTFLARKCDGWFDYATGLCHNNPTSVMGGLNLDEKKGEFYLKTNSKKPYAEGSTI